MCFWLTPRGSGVGGVLSVGRSSVTHALRLLVFEGFPLSRMVARAGELVTAQSPDLVATVVVARYRPATGAGTRGGWRPSAIRRPSSCPPPATVPLARHLMADWLEHLVADDDERADLLLVASELCSNAVRRSSGAPTSLVLRARAEADAVVIEVEDDGRGFATPIRDNDDVLDGSAEQGRGMYLARALTDELEAFRRDGHTVVRAVKRAVLPAP